MNCILSEPCSLHNGPECSRLCPSYIAIHGYNGSGGRVGAANTPDDYRLVTLTNSPARVEQAEAYRLIDAYVTTFTRQFDGDMRVKSLYLFSESPGTGKTTTAIAVLNAWIIAHYIGSLKRNRQTFERPAYFLDVNAWQTDFNTFNRPRVPDSIAEPAAKRYYDAQLTAMSAPFVVLDDIGVRDASDAFRGDIHAVINERVTNALPTVYTSNIPMSELGRVYDARLADRIRDMCIELTFIGGSRRGIRNA